MKYLSILFFAIWLYPQMAAQPDNLVRNPGFEEVTAHNSFDTCEYNKEGKRFTKSVANWMCFQDLTTDFIIWGEGCRYPQPHGGDKMVGIITYHPYLDTGWNTDYHEFVQGELTTPLQPGTTYEVAFYIHQNDSIAEHHLLGVYGRKVEVIPTAAGNIGVYFSTSKFPKDENMGWNVAYDAIFPQVNHSEPVVTSYGEWKRIQKTFKADQPYRYFVIGNFKKDEDTETTLQNADEIDLYNELNNSFWDKKKRVAYYCIDDISVKPANQEHIHRVEFTSNSFTEDTYTFRHVTFPSGQSELLPASLPELDGLVDYLLQNPDVRAEIAGHTDHIGNEQDNQILSEKRAEAVYQYFVFKGVPPDRLTFRGYGESEPVESNETAAGRRENRRVECRVENE